MKLKLIIVVIFYASILYGQQELWPVQTKAGYGLINKNGVLMVNPSYSYISEFRDGLAYFKDSVGNGFMDFKGDVVFRTDYLVNYFSENLASIMLNGHTYFIDKKGKIVIKPRFNNYIVGCTTSCFSRFSEGLAPLVITDNKQDGWYNFIYINKFGRVVFNRSYKYAQNFSEGLAFVKFNDDKCGYINKVGQLVISLNSDQSGFEFSEGYALIYDDSFNSYYYIDNKGHILGNLTFKNADSFSGGMAKVTFDKNWPQKWGYINTKGEVIVDPQFINCTKFSNDLACVRILENSYDGHLNVNTFIINKLGEVVFGPFQNTVIQEYKNGLAFGIKTLSNDCNENFFINLKGIIIRRDTICSCDY
ncbi:MAG TPA: WG repeat-containing protein [Bacteroidales bacterium]|nr:WG repeat-containing protein [Bacteroidales bacterium]HPI68927.1 WG repeat-containing protein [Bacteroidales bacterium]HPR72480.1 WG repeat-containing protein [Bacteroidales bacterium]HRW86140.1 WG repeat-containing protein [Bacteroidales bacterium]